jgi:hypothetical protein
MYKDKDKQREANKSHAKAYRLRKGMTVGYDAGMTKLEGMTQGMTETPVIKTKADAMSVVSRLDSRGRLAFCMKHRCYKQTCKCE